MATSGTYTFGMTAREVITYALRKLRIVDAVENVSGTDAALAMQELNVMLKGWQLEGPNLWRVTSGELALVANQASYTLATQHPFRIVNANFYQSGREVPMFLLTQEEYNELPLKLSTGIPTTYYYDAQRDDGTLYVWPVLAAANGETIRFTYQRRFQDVSTLDKNIDIPQEYLGLVGYSLAHELMPTFGVDNPEITKRAMSMRMTADSADREPVIRFEPDRRR